MEDKKQFILEIDKDGFTELKVPEGVGFPGDKDPRDIYEKCYGMLCELQKELINWRDKQ
ncbi:MAG: hypothetical protein II661_06255 [Bacteroidales bacterium]|nr:hypothetical protein [Bacteroidales bacterium]